MESQKQCEIGKKQGKVTQHPMGETGKKWWKKITTQRVEKSSFSSKGTNRWRQQVMAYSNSQMHRKDLEEKASRIKEISITEKKGTEAEKGVKNWVWQKV